MPKPDLQFWTFYYLGEENRLPSPSSPLFLCPGVGLASGVQATYFPEKPSFDKGNGEETKESVLVRITR